MNVLKKITRVEFIDHSPCRDCNGEGTLNDQLCPTCQGKQLTGRTVMFNDPNKEVALEVQDEGRTLKLFVSAKGTTGVENVPSDLPDYNAAPSMALDDLIADIEAGPDSTEFPVDPSKPTMVLDGVPGTDQLSENEA